MRSRSPPLAAACRSGPARLFWNQRRRLRRTRTCELVERDLLQRLDLRTGEAELVRGTFVVAERARIAPGESAEDDERLEIVAVRAPVVVVVGPQIHLAGFDAIVGVGIGHARLDGARPRLADRNHRLDTRGARSGLVVSGPHVA